MSLFADTSLWPAASDVEQITKNGRRFYRSTTGAFEGDFPGVTSVLKVLGIGSEGLIRWAANLEHEAVLEAAEAIHNSGLEFASFRNAVEAKVGTARQHQRALQKAGDIGSQVHEAIRAYCHARIDKVSWVGQQLEPIVAAGYGQWLDWFLDSGLKPIRTEQVVWNSEHKYAGTIDLIAENSSGQLEVWDWKTSKAIYDEYHLQVVAYCDAASNFVPVKPGGIVRLPKTAADSLEVVKVGEGLYGGRTKSLDELRRAFLGARQAFEVLCE